MNPQTARLIKKEADKMFSVLNPEIKKRTSRRMVYRKMKKLYTQGKLKIKKVIHEKV